MNLEGISLTPARSTQHQRAEIVRLLRKVEMDTRRVTLMHRLVGVPDSFIDRPVDEWMCTLSVDAANGVIRTLQARI